MYFCFCVACHIGEYISLDLFYFLKGMLNLPYVFVLRTLHHMVMEIQGCDLGGVLLPCITYMPEDSFYKL